MGDTAFTRGFIYGPTGLLSSALRSMILFSFVDSVLGHFDFFISPLPFPPVPVVVSVKCYLLSPVCFSLCADPFGPLNADLHCLF